MNLLQHGLKGLLELFLPFSCKSLIHFIMWGHVVGLARSYMEPPKLGLNGCQQLQEDDAFLHASILWILAHLPLCFCPF